MKSLKEISWEVSEDTYRADPALSYSTLARYEREGFSNLDKLFDKVDTPSLLLGSLVDCYITGSTEEFNERFLIADFPSVPDSIIAIVKELFKWCNTTNRTLESIKNDFIIQIASKYNYQNNWKPETRAKVIKEKGAEYYSLLYLAGDKVIVSTEMNNTALSMTEALKNSEATKWYFQPDNPFENIERLYQLKFKATLHGINYRCMMDLCIVDHDKKTLQPIDLKTSFKREYEFYKSFIEWNYQIQNRLYFRVLQDNILRDGYFKDFKILPYKDVVVCKESLTPLVWDCDFTYANGTLTFGKDGQFIMRDPEDIGKELTYYLKNKPKVPLEIDEFKPNNLRYWLNKL